MEVTGRPLAAARQHVRISPGHRISSPNAAPLPIARPNPDTRTSPWYQLNVIAFNVVDVVQSAGGWLFDQAMAGWDVSVLLVEHGDPRPLQILGARALDLDAELACTMSSSTEGRALAVAANLFEADEGVRDEILASLDRGITNVTLWGDNIPAKLRFNVDLLTYPPSRAARAFKAHALAAAAVPHGASVGPTETLIRGG